MAPALSVLSSISSSTTICRRRHVKVGSEEEIWIVLELSWSSVCVCVCVCLRANMVQE